MKHASGLVVLGFLCSSVFAAEPPAQALTFEDRVAAQRAIEAVYWRHRIWPAENATPKPSLATVVSESTLRDKVADVLEKSNALGTYWRRPITSEQLRAEVHRMAANTRRPGVLRELFSALGNDPQLIAECLARPILADRLLRNWYATDSRIHGELRQQAESALACAAGTDSMPSLGGRYDEWVIELGAESNPLERPGEPDGSVRVLGPDEWDREVRSLAARFEMSPGEPGETPEPDTASVVARLPLERIGPLRDDGDAFSAIAVLDRNEGRLRIARVRWQKLAFDEWWNRKTFEPMSDANAPTSTYAAVAVTSSECTDDTWAPIGTNAPEGLARHAAVWTGSEMIVWGEGKGQRYDPSTDTWAQVSTGGDAPTATGSSVVWTGTEMIVWGGVAFAGGYTNSGGRYDPLTNSWIRTTTSGFVPAGRTSATAVWTGREMIVWGGTTATGSYFNSGGRYDPAGDSWTPTSTSSEVPSPRYHHTAVWTGRTMIVWGGATVDPITGNSTRYQTGAQYDPGTDAWTSTDVQSNAPAARELHTAVWADNRMIVWGGEGVGLPNTGGRYDPSTNSWLTTSAVGGAPTARRYHTAVWTGGAMVVWGGLDASAQYANSGGRYDPSTDAWTATSLVNAPDGRQLHTAVWTGSEMIVWGGWNGQSLRLATGGRYDTAADSWVPTNASGTVPVARYGNSAVWTGGEMIVWGGNPTEGNYNNLLNSGGRYEPATDTWTPTSLKANVPSARTSATAVWTGREMVVWGGYAPVKPNTGGRYDPATDRWAPTSLTGAPVGRSGHTAIWTGHEMVVWGGLASGFLNSGGRYNPSTDTWRTTSTAGAASARYEQAAVWAGSEMIVWGGFGNAGWLASGGRYAPKTDVWRPMSSAGGLAGRTSHTAVWTGQEMIVWGGYPGGGVALGSGGRYDPRNDAWTTFSAAFRRYAHSAVWTGSEMIVWGGVTSTSSPPQTTGARYDPATGTWVSTSTAPGAPTLRKSHTAVWTGSEMLIWGGVPFTTMGARYCAVSPCDVQVWFNDEDHDGYGDPADTVLACDEPYDASRTSGDCDDGNPSVHPGFPETCNGIDDDCSGGVDDGLGVTICGVGSCTRAVDYCVNGQPQTCVPGSPAPEVCNGFDDNCDGVLDDGGSALCDDGNGCTDDVCGGRVGCVLTDNANACDDANACTTIDTCGGGDCNPGPPINCDDVNCCTLDSCDPATGCIHAANTTAPVFTTRPSLGNTILWPPNHGYADFTIAETGVAAAGACGIASIRFDSCRSSQPENGTGTGDGNTFRDCVYEPDVLHLRAERDGACSPIGRIYQTTLVAVDVCGNATTSESFGVGVFHGRGSAPVEGTIVHAAGNGSETREGINGTYGTGCGAGAASVNGTEQDLSDADPEMEISQGAAIGVNTLTLVKGEGGIVALSWSVPSDLVPVHVTRYHVYRLDPGTPFWTMVAEVTGQTTSYDDPSLHDGTNRRYKVTAVIK